MTEKDRHTLLTRINRLAYQAQRINARLAKLEAELRTPRPPVHPAKGWRYNTEEERQEARLRSRREASRRRRARLKAEAGE